MSSRGTQLQLEARLPWLQVRRLRRLSISFIATIANYEYAFYWYLYQVTRSSASK